MTCEVLTIKEVSLLNMLMDERYPQVSRVKFRGMFLVLDMFCL